MANLKILSATQQVAQHLRSELFSGRWTGTMPGESRLIKELSAGRATVKAALCQLEEEGLLVSQGHGKRRQINLAAGEISAPSMRVQILLYEKIDRQLGYLAELLHMLQEAGHEAVFADRTLDDLGMNVDRVARYVQSNQADAWVVFAGSRDVLEWFAQQETPAFGLYGRLMGVSLAGTAPKKGGAHDEAVDRLVALGHQRIVFLVREDRRKPKPGFLEQLFLQRLESHGIKIGAYHLPDWEESVEGLQSMLDSLFQHTPPTAMMIDGPPLFHAVRHYLGNHGILVPDDVSLICTDPDPNFEWCLPTIAHVTWDNGPIVRRIVKWMENISQGKEDRRKSSTKARLVIGGTMGPAPAE